MMHQDSLEPAAIRFTLERLQESARQSGYFSLLFHVFISTGTLGVKCSVKDETLMGCVQKW